MGNFKHLILLTLLVGFVFSACKKEDGSLSLTFKPEYDGAPLVMFEEKSFNDFRAIKFSAVNFFLSDVKLEKDGVVTELGDISLVDMSASSLAGAEAGATIFFDDIEPGDYDRLTFGIGVPDDLNNKEPGDFSSDHPLSNGGFYWMNWNSYIFSKTEGTMDTVGNGTFDLGWLVHTGSAVDSLGNINFDAYRSFSTPNMISVKEDATTDVNFRVDYKVMLQENGIPFDLHIKPRNHNPNDTARLKVFVNNYSNAISIEN
jgi:hypothetical protein